MAKIKPLIMLKNDLAKTKDVFKKAMIESLIQTSEYAALQAKLNSTKQFTGRWGRTLSGRLLNSIYNTYEPKNLKAIIGTRGIPYGRIHELGGKINPVNANYLWQRMPDANEKGTKFRRLTPAQFYQLAKSNDAYFYHKTDDGKTFAAYAPDNSRVKILFWLRKEVKIKARPYINPAAKDAADRFPGIFKKRLDSKMGDI